MTLAKKKFLDSAGAAKYVGLTRRTLDYWRTSKRESAQRIPYTKVGRLVRYDPDDLDAWLASRKVNV